jgi:hypothetical protein
MSVAGNYNVVATSQYECTSTSSVYYLTPTGTHDLNNVLSGFDVYPNPTTGEFTIHFELVNSQDVHLSVRDMLGKIVFDESLDKFNGTYNHAVDVTQHAKGVYIVEVDSENQSAHKKVVVQ